MGFPEYTPTVFVIGREYEISLRSEESGIFSVEVGGQVYYEENSGVLSSEKNYAKIRVPQGVLDAARGYEAVLRRVKRKAYFSEISPPERKKFSFRPPRENKMRLFHIADVHGSFREAEALCARAEDIDLFVVNGDIGEVEREKDFLDVLEFLGHIAGGKIPVLFVRGNHDARGKLAEKFVEYFPAEGKRTYFTFSFGKLNGLVFDCGEDKRDRREEYGGGEGEIGVNVFEEYRRRQTEFFKRLSGEYPLAVGHIPPVQTTLHRGDIFDIERDVYSEWNKEFGRLGVRLMLCGHLHQAYYLKEDDERNLLPHKYPVAVGSAYSREEGHTVLTGTEIELRDGSASLRFLDSEGNTGEELEVPFPFSRENHRQG